MKHLRQYIRQILLNESAKTPEDIGDMNIEIEFTPGSWIAVSLWKEVSGFKTRVGEVHAEKAAPVTGSCYGAYEVVWTNAEGAPGFGPMLYDIAMELAGDEGLMCDRGTVSKEASRVWEYYLNNRPDVVAKQLDDRRKPFLQNPGKNDPSDDCAQGTFRRKTKRMPASSIDDSGAGFKDEFLNHWSTKVYVKNGGTPILDKLEVAGKVTRK